MLDLKRALFPDHGLGLVKVVPPQDGGWSLTPTENLLRGIRGDREVVSLELFGRDGVVFYRVRSNHPQGVAGVFRSYFPQARLDLRVRHAEPETEDDDWLFLDEDEYGMVLPLYLRYPAYLPLRIFEDRTLEQSALDPLAGVIGLVSNATRTVGGAPGGDRLGLRLIARPAKEDWGAVFQKRMQQRRDGEDRNRPLLAGEGGGVGLVPMLGVASLAGLAGLNWWLYRQGDLPVMLGVDAAILLGAAAGLRFYRRVARMMPGRRPYMDEELVDAKLKSLSFHAELQLVRVYRNIADADVARESLAEMVECLRSFDNPAGNQWMPGRLRVYSGQNIMRGAPVHPFRGGSGEMEWLDSSRAKRSVLSAREVASLWHLPLGADEMASMERTSSGMLTPFLDDLTRVGEDTGPLVGVSAGDLEVYLPESALRKHMLVIGKSGVGKSTVIKHILAYKLARKAAGLDRGAVVVIDPHADLVRDTMRVVPESIVDKVRLLDFGRMDRVPGLNLVDPYLFPDRDRCVGTIVNTVKNLWEHWGNRLEDLLRNSLSIVYEFNCHPDTPRSEMLTMLDILLFLDDGVTVGSGANARTEMGSFQKYVLERVSDPRLKQWVISYLGWGRETRSEAVGPVHSRIGAYAANTRASVVMGQRESTIVLSDVLSEGLVLFVSTASGTIGAQPAALMGGTMVSLVESAIRDQERLPPSQRVPCLLVCDEFQSVTGADWESMLAEIRKYGGSVCLATQSMARLDTGERRLKDGILGNTGVIMAYTMSAADARIIAPEMDADRVKERFLVNVDPHHCYARITSDQRVYPVFSMRTLPPPDMVRGSDAAVNSVLKASEAYTVDWMESRRRMNDEISRQLSLANKLDLRLDSGRSSEPRVSVPSVSAVSDAATAAASSSSRGVLSDEEVRKVEREVLSAVRDRGRRPGEAYDRAVAAGEVPLASRAAAGNEDDALRGRVVREGLIPSGPLRGLRETDVEGSSIPKDILSMLMQVRRNDPGLKALLNRRLNSALHSERDRVRREEADRIREEAASEAAKGPAAGIPAAAGVPAVDEDALRERIRAEERAALQSKYDMLEREQHRFQGELDAARRMASAFPVVGGTGLEAGAGIPEPGVEGEGSESRPDGPGSSSGLESGAVDEDRVQALLDFGGPSGSG